MSLIRQMVSETEISSEKKLIRRAKRGDRAAFGYLVERYQDQVYTLACRTLGDSDRAEDVAQEAFIRAWRAISGFKEKAKFSSWLYRITLNSCFSELRRKGKPVDRFPQGELEALKQFADTRQNVETTIEKRDMVARLIRELPPIYRSIVVLYYLQDFSCREIASLLERPEGTVKAYLHRARAQLRTRAEQLLQTRSPSK